MVGAFCVRRRCKKVQNSIPAIKGKHLRASRVYVFSNWTLQMHSTRHEKEPLQLAGCENRWWGKEGVFHGHPAKREGHGWSSITAGIRKRQRFRVVSWRLQEVRETVNYSTPGHTIQV